MASTQDNNPPPPHGRNPEELAHEVEEYFHDLAERGSEQPIEIRFSGPLDGAVEFHRFRQAQKMKCFAKQAEARHAVE